MKVEQLREGVENLKSEITRLIKDFEEQSGVSININTYHRFPSTLTEQLSQNQYTDNLPHVLDVKVTLIL